MCIDERHLLTPRMCKHSPQETMVRGLRMGPRWQGIGAEAQLRWEGVCAGAGAAGGAERPPSSSGLCWRCVCTDLGALPFFGPLLIPTGFSAAFRHLHVGWPATTLIFHNCSVRFHPAGHRSTGPGPVPVPRLRQRSQVSACGCSAKRSMQAKRNKVPGWSKRLLSCLSAVRGS